jgi:hypothetical protein
MEKNVAARSNCRACWEGAIALNGGRERCNCYERERERERVFLLYKFSPYECMVQRMTATRLNKFFLNFTDFLLPTKPVYFFSLFFIQLYMELLHEKWTIKRVVHSFFKRAIFVENFTGCKPIVMHALFKFEWFWFLTKFWGDLKKNIITYSHEWNFERLDQPHLQ